MRHTKLLAAIFVTLGAIGLTALAQTQTRPAKSPEWFQPMIRAVEAAATPAEAQAAYARASVIDGNNAELMSTYVRRLVAFDLPEAVYETAQKLVALDPTHGPSWAVIAHMRMRLGQPVEALSALLKAAELRGEDPFVLRTAADLIARHEYEGQSWQIGDDLKARIEKLKDRLAKNETFAAAYRQKRSEYELIARLEQARLEQVGAAGQEGQTPPTETQPKELELKQYEDEYPYLTGKRADVDVDIDIGYRSPYYYYDDYRYRYFPYYGPYYYPYYGSYYYPYYHHGVVGVHRGFHGKRPFKHGSLFHNRLSHNPLISGHGRSVIDDATVGRFARARAAGFSPRRAAAVAVRDSRVSAAGRGARRPAARASVPRIGRVGAAGSRATIRRPTVVRGPSPVINTAARRVAGRLNRTFTRRGTGAGTVGNTTARSRTPMIRRSIFSGRGSRSSGLRRSGIVGRSSGGRSLSSLRGSSARLRTSRSAGGGRALRSLRGGAGGGRALRGLRGGAGGRMGGRTGGRMGGRTGGRAGGRR